jgi:hypothetical protein
MTYLVDKLLGISADGEVGPDLLDGVFATLGASASGAGKLLDAYVKHPARADFDDVTEDLHVHQQLFAYGVLAALDDSIADPFQAFGTFASADDRLFKVGALFRLGAFLSFGELYTRPGRELERILWEGNVTSPWFRHLYLYEVLARGPRMQLSPWQHVRHHGRNIVELFATEQAIAAVRNGRVAAHFQSGLLDRLGAAMLAPQMAEGYAAFFDACIGAQRRELADRQGDDGKAGAWTRASFRRHVLQAFLADQFERPLLAAVLGMAGFTSGKD